MDDDTLKQLPWLPELLAQVRSAFCELEQRQPDQREALQAELQNLERSRQGWSQSMGDPDLPRSLWLDISRRWEEADQRYTEIQTLLDDLMGRFQSFESSITPELVLEHLQRLPEILASQDPTRGNLELGLHIDQIRCHTDGRVVMRTCKLGLLPETIDLFSRSDCPSIEDTSSQGLRRRARLRTEGDKEGSVDLRALADFVADPNRFAGLDEAWFWTDEFQKPEPTSWATEHAEAVFQRRQQARLSYRKLADEFGVTPPTARAALRHYLGKHPEAKDEVQLPRGAPRRPRVNIEEFAAEALDLWLTGEWSKLRLAKRFECSPPTVDKAMASAAEIRGIQVPTAAEIRHEKIRQVRAAHDQGTTLNAIAAQLKISDVTAREYLNASYEADGQSKPDFRRKPDRRTASS